MSDDAMRPLSCDDVRELAGAFVLGALDAAEEAQVRAHLAGDHAAGHPEIAELGSVIPAFFEAVEVVEPPEGLKARIMAAAAADLAARGGGTSSSAGGAPSSAAGAPEAEAGAPGGDAPSTTGEAAPAPPSIDRTGPAPIAFPSAAERERRRTSRGEWILRIAAVLAIAVLGGWNLLLQGQLNASQAYERNVAAVLDVAAQPGSLTAVLAPDGDTGSGLAAVNSAGDLALAMRDLAPTTGTTVYEAWVIGADGVPVPIGNFQVGGSGVGFLQAGGLPAAEGIVLALTREPGPGATTPTMPIISAGVATAPG
jgi:anti-sigma-K factor RskA